MQHCQENFIMIDLDAEIRFKLDLSDCDVFCAHKEEVSEGDLWFYPNPEYLDTKKYLSDKYHINWGDLAYNTSIVYFRDINDAKEYSSSALEYIRNINDINPSFEGVAYILLAEQRFLYEYAKSKELKVKFLIEGKYIPTGAKNGISPFIESNLEEIAEKGFLHVWGFKNETMHIPDVDSLERVRSVVGWKNLTIVDESVVRKKTDLKIDLGGIAKGYAVDRAWEVLDRMGIESFLINAGGEIRCKGDGWTAGIQDPTDPGQVKVVIAPNDKAVATSGDYQNYFEVDGTRYCHIFDPSTGFPAEKVASVTVLADDVATADALATALFVAGLEKSTEIMKKFAGCEYIVIGKDGKLHFSTGAKRYLLK